MREKNSFLSCLYVNVGEEERREEQLPVRDAKAFAGVHPAALRLDCEWPNVLSKPVYNGARSLLCCCGRHHVGENRSLATTLIDLLEGLNQLRVN